MRNGNGQGYGYVWVVLIAIVFFVALIGMFISFDTVEANHLGVKVKFGKILGTMRPGIEYTGPFVQVNQYDMRIRKAKVDMLGEQSATDSGGQAVYGSVSVNYRLSPSEGVVESLYANVGDDRVIADRLNIEPIIKEGFKQATVEFEAIEILQNRQAVKESAQENIKNNFPKEYFEIVDIVVENIDFSPEFKKAIEDKKIATQNKLKEEEMVEVIKFQQQQVLEVAKVEAQRLNLQKQEITDKLNTQKLLDRWDGRLPQYLIITEGSQGMFLQLAKGNIGELKNAEGSISKNATS